MKLLFLFLIFFSCQGESPLPNSTLTPGDTNPALTKDVICAPTFRTGPYRNVPLALKKKVFKAYGIPWADHAKYEVDHLESLEIGGSNDQKNLWPEPWHLDDGTGHDVGAKTKDLVENALHRQVCRGGIALADAQKMIAKDWRAAYKKFVSQAFPALQRGNSHLNMHPTFQ